MQFRVSHSDFLNAFFFMDAGMLRAFNCILYQMFSDLFTEPEVFITISPVVDPPVDGVIQDTMIELSWARFPAPGSEDWIGLFDFDPTAAEASTDYKAVALTFVSLNSTALSGYVKTPVRFGRPPLNASSMGDNCLGFWVSYMKSTNGESTPLVTNCFRKYPTW